MHIFNPEHDMALAAGSGNLTLPHAIQEFKTNLGYLPALWANDGDFVLVDDILYATKALSQINKPHADVIFITLDDLKHLEFSRIEPWGWDMTIRDTLAGAGVNMNILPNDDVLAYTKYLSSRQRTTEVLQFMREGLDYTCGENVYCQSTDEVGRCLEKYNKIVIKSPWSSSGRGVRYADGALPKPLEGWMEKTINRQGGVMVEPYYKKVKDFALEFYSNGNGDIDYRGISLFETSRSNYKGNIVASEVEKLHILGEYIPLSVISLMTERFRKYFSTSCFVDYIGPLGVDMMVVAGNGSSGFMLHPCVEINVRRTMGHVANSFTTSVTDPKQLMHIVHNVNYKLKFDCLENNFVKVI